MLKEARLEKEIVVTVVNKIGVLADMSKVLSDHGISVTAVAGYVDNGNARIMLITDDNLRAADALKKKRYSAVEEREVVSLILEDKPGVLRKIAEKLAAANIDINYIYGTTCPTQCPARIILSTTDNQKALVVFKK